MSFNQNGDNRQSQSSSPDEIELTIQAAEKEDHTFETVDTDDDDKGCPLDFFAVSFR